MTVTGAFLSGVRSLLLCGSVSCMLAASTAAAEEALQSLFTDPGDWSVVGGEARFRLLGDELIGDEPEIGWLGGENSFYTSRKTYADFVLEYEYKITPDANSGVQIRSRLDESSGNLTGYQVEIDHDPGRARYWAGGIYDEKGRGWLYPQPETPAAGAFTEQGARLIKTDDWNQVRVEARGDSIRVWLNGELRSDLRDTAASEGVIGFQVHSSSNPFASEEVRFRRARIKEL